MRARRGAARGVIALAALAAAVTVASCSPGAAPLRRPRAAGRALDGRAAAGRNGIPARDQAVPLDVRAENSLPGDPHWRITHPAHLRQLEGYADRTDVLPGEPFRLLVSTTARSFRVLAFRMGWYGGDLARLVWTSPPVPGRLQPPPRVSQPGSLVSAPWRPSLTVSTAGWPPGSYLLRLDASTGVQAYVPVVVRSPSAAGRVVLVQPVTSYQAYNGWGGYDLYNGGPKGTFADRARRVSFDRPYSYGRGAGGFFLLEFPLVVLAERMGLPLAYLTSIDLERYPQVLDGARAVISEGHDEYYSPAMRATLTRARDRGSNLAFFGANAIYRKIRFEPSALGPDRVEVNYKIPREDPLYGRDNALVTGNWPDPPDANPESSLTGESYGCFTTASVPLVITGAGGWLWAGAHVADGEALPEVVGPEYDWLDPAYPIPRPIESFASSPVYCNGQILHAAITYYVARSGAGVLDAGTEDWICGLPYGSCQGAARHLPSAIRRVLAAATANVLRAFAAGRAGRAHPVPG